MTGRSASAFPHADGGQQQFRNVQIGWMNPTTGVMCDCPVYETSPHANSVPVYKEVAQ